MLLSYQRVHGGTILFENKGKSSIIGSGDVDLSEMIKIKEVNFVEDLQYNLLSVSQLCDQGKNEVRFTVRDVKVVSPKGYILLKGKWVGSTYIFDYEFSLNLPVCLSAISAASQLCINALVMLVYTFLTSCTKRSSSVGCLKSMLKTCLIAVLARGGR